ncbi:hypothetical protein [Pseudomonas entomophila]|uniref:Uncharacterized protein n=2 Tax=Pseudomonas entomophila TaxID=312306 RepID=Q1I5K0_PSEE4|nr:hypothetical protein [Pseudomonas entomophila]WMW07189.1 hypothetical protein RAH46_07585 [Pseudomonas entomophila]CAK17085.1 hypothetical protein PSEEN4401 [Pseudomonas entomophila L48]
MKPIALVNALEHNSRQAEQTRREAEQTLYAQLDQEARLEDQITSKLGQIATLQLNIDPELDLQTRQLFEQREHARANLVQALERVEQLIATRLDKRQQVRSDLGQLDAQAQRMLDEDPAFARLQERLNANRQAEQQSDASYAEIRNECANKLEGYKSNPLYRFLKACGYGTEQYRPYLFQRTLDDYLARKVDFHANYANEQTLLAMYTRNETQRQTLAQTRQQLQAQHQQHLEKAREAAGMQALLAEEQELEVLLSEAKANASSLHAQLADFNQQRDPHLLQIRQSITDRLRARPLAELIIEAARTPNPDDDLLVSDLQLLHARLREIQQHLNGLRDESDKQRQRYDRAKTLEYALRDAHYRDPSHEYRLQQPIEQILDDYMRGQLEQSEVQRLLDEGRQFVSSQHWDDSRSPSRGNDSTSSHGTSGSFGGGGFSTSSSSGGGGFRTTDSF